jgi:integrase
MREHLRQLRLFDPTEGAAPGRQSLTEFFTSWLRPRLVDDGRSPRTLESYEFSLRLWEQATRNADGSPATVETIDDALARRFTRALAERTTARGQPLSPNTRRKHVGAIQAVIDRLLPRGRGNPLGAGLLPDVPALPKPQPLLRDVDAVGIATRDDVRRLLLAAAAWDRQTRRRVGGWRDLYRLAFYTGCRPQALLAAQSDWLLDDDLSREFSGRWLAIPAAASKTRRPYRVFLAAATTEFVAALERRAGRWFAVPSERSWFSTRRRRLEQAAGVAAKSRGFKPIRKLLGTELAAINFAAAQLQLGHAAANVTLDHYTGRRVQAAAVSQRLPLVE